MSSGAPDPEKIVDIPLASEMEGSFLEYAYSVIYSRALPDARDGLKPVQRRILYQMDRMGLRPDRGYVKCSRVVGEVMGKLHPHGDSAIYDAMVRLAQPFTLRLALIDGHGNFGSLDDGPAAPRYTEARLQAAAQALTADIDEDTVDFVPNYDNQLMQPEVLPAAWPALLVNGAAGIAVGMATNMAPHNLGEVIAAARHLLANPQATTEDLMRHIPGPDLPEGGIIAGLDGVRQAYETGRGSFKTRALAKVEKITARKRAIVVTQLPYLVGPEKVIEKIKEGVNNKRLAGITNVQNLTDRHHGLRLVIELKSTVNPDAVLEALYRYTPLEDSFSINSVALVKGQPRTLGLRDLLEVYLSHRLEVVTRRTGFRLRKHRERAHLVDGLLIAIADIDEVIEVIRTSDDADAARQRLRQIFDLSQEQADYILELRLRRLTRFSTLELNTEREQLAQAIAELEEILASKDRLRRVVSQELAEVAEKFSTPRRTVLLEAAAVESTGGKPGAIPLEIPDTPCRVLLSTTGKIARTATGEPLERSEARVSHDALLASVATTARGQVGAVTNLGRIVRLEVLHCPTLADGGAGVSLAGGARVSELVELGRGERVVSIVELEPEGPTVTLATREGVVKRVSNERAPGRDSWEIISLKDGDEVVGATQADSGDTLVFITSDAQLLRYDADLVRPQGRAGQGIAGIRLAQGASVISFAAVKTEQLSAAVVVTVAAGSSGLPGMEDTTAKVTALDRFPAKGRATGGVRAQRFLRDEDHLALAWCGYADARAVDGEGRPVKLPPLDERRDGSGKSLSTRPHSIG